MVGYYISGSYNPWDVIKPVGMISMHYTISKRKTLSGILVCSKMENLLGLGCIYFSLLKCGLEKQESNNRMI